MSEQIMPLELSVDELDAVAGGAIDLDITSDFKQVTQVEKSTEFFANGKNGAIFFSEEFTASEVVESDLNVSKEVNA